jgi:hypothetical protein
LAKKEKEVSLPGKIISGRKASVWDKSGEFIIMFEERNSYEVKGQRFRTYQPDYFPYRPAFLVLARHQELQLQRRGRGSQRRRLHFRTEGADIQDKGLGSRFTVDRGYLETYVRAGKPAPLPNVSLALTVV